MKPDDKFIADFCAQMEERLSPFSEVGNDLKNNIRAVAEAVLGKMDIVSRAELDEQNALLAEAVAKMAELEEKIIALEQNAPSKKDGKAEKSEKSKTAQGGKSTKSENNEKSAKTTEKN